MFRRPGWRDGCGLPDLVLDELQTKCRFVLRIATATFRDTFLSGRGAVSDSQHYLEIHQTELDHLRDDLTEMAFGYLQLEEHRQVDAG